MDSGSALIGATAIVILAVASSGVTILIMMTVATVAIGTLASVSCYRCYN